MDKIDSDGLVRRVLLHVTFIFIMPSIGFYFDAIHASIFGKRFIIIQSTILLVTSFFFILIFTAIYTERDTQIFGLLWDMFIFSHFSNFSVAIVLPVLTYLWSIILLLINIIGVVLFRCVDSRYKQSSDDDNEHKKININTYLPSEDKNETNDIKNLNLANQVVGIQSKSHIDGINDAINDAETFDDTDNEGIQKMTNKKGENIEMMTGGSTSPMHLNTNFQMLYKPKTEVQVYDEQRRRWINGILLYFNIILKYIAVYIYNRRSYGN